MAVIGCYSLDLYCDTGGDPYGGTCPSHVPGRTACAQFTGRSERDCLSQARKRGWTFHTGRAYCPRCSKARKGS